MDWFHGPINDILGVPAFWVQRVAKVVQFLAATVIVLEIAGKDRVEEWAGALRKLLARAQSAEPLRGPVANVRSWVRVFVGRYTAPPGSPEQEAYLRAIEEDEGLRLWMFSLSMLGGGIALCILLVGYYDWRDWLLLLIPVVVVGHAFVSYLLVYGLIPALLLPLLVYATRPIDWFVRVSADRVIRLLERRTLSQLALIASAILLTLGTIFEILAS
jgi:hypothetical protein